jgi:hypothetical protein
MKMVAWLFITVPLIYLIAIAAFITYHYLVVDYPIRHVWFFGSRILLVSTISSIFLIFFGIGLIKANK